MKLCNKKTGEIADVTLSNSGDTKICVTDNTTCEGKGFYSTLAALNAEWEDAPEEKKYGGRVPKVNDKYYYIDERGQVGGDEWNDTDYDREVFEYGNAFWTIKEAEKEVARRKAYVILKEDTKGFEPEWGEGGGFKYCVFYGYTDHVLIAVSARYIVSDRIYFATKEDAEASIKAHEKEWKTYLGVEE